jgi:hypothetical protein
MGDPEAVKHTMMGVMVEAVSTAYSSVNMSEKM